MYLKRFLLLDMICGNKGFSDGGKGNFGDWGRSSQRQPGWSRGTEKRVEKKMKEATILNNLFSEPSVFLRFR